MNFKDNKVYLALGSNLGNRKQNIQSAIQILKNNNIKVNKIAPLYLNPALLMPDAPSEFNKAFLNTVIEVETELLPENLLKLLKNIEIQLERISLTKWSPRTIDIDIIYYKGIELNQNNLQIPHYALFERSFVLDPLAYITPQLQIYNKSILQQSRLKKTHIPAIMAILNITPDSFSGDGKYHLVNQEIVQEIEKNIQQLIENGINIIDIGAESTRPNAELISQEEEITRLSNIFHTVKAIDSNLFTRFSIDTRYYDTAKKAIQSGFGIINDVSGLADMRMLDLIRDNDVELILMHNLGLPADPNKTLDLNSDIFNAIQKQFDQWKELLTKNHISLNKVIFDIGVGFGKNIYQSLELIKNFEKFVNLNSDVRLLVGHSRKRFLSILSEEAEHSKRDLETILTSFLLADKGVDVIRVHDAITHQKAFLVKSGV